MVNGFYEYLLYVIVMNKINIALKPFRFKNPNYCFSSNYYVFMQIIHISFCLVCYPILAYNALQVPCPKQFAIETASRQIHYYLRVTEHFHISRD